MGGSSKSIISGYNYWGSYALAICHGPVTRLHKISNGETDIWEGPIDSTSADGDGKTTLNTELGTIQFYWGSASQNPDSVLSNLQIDSGGGPVAVPIPAWRGVCYAVCQDIAFGQQVVPPTLLFHVERRLAALTLSSHAINEDAVVPEIIYDLLTSTDYGAELVAGSEIDAASFQAAGETTITEGIGCSLNLDSTSSVREVIGQLLSYIDGYLYRGNGKIFLGLTRQASTVGLQVIDESDLLEEPRPSPSHFDGTWNKTVVTFSDRENKWEESTEDYDDPANAAIVGREIVKEFAFPWVTSRPVAQKLAKLLGIRGGLPACFWELALKPEFATLQVGERFKLSYAAFGITERVVRVKRITIGRPSSPTVTLTVQEEQTRSTANDYVPTPDVFEVPGVVDEDGTDEFTLEDTTPRVSILPAMLRQLKDDGVLVAFHRPSPYVVGGTVYWTWNPVQQPYRSLNKFKHFPAAAQLICWHRIRTSSWMLRIQLGDGDYEQLQSLRDNSPSLFCVIGRRDYKSVGTQKNEHQVLSPWLKYVDGGRFELVDATTIDIEVAGAAFGTTDLRLEGAVDDGYYPTLHCYFGRASTIYGQQSDFFVYPTDDLYIQRSGGNAFGDTDQKRYFKVTVANHETEQALVDVDAVNYDRNDATMNASGTFSTEWGARVATTYELFDIQGGLEMLGEAAPDYPTVEDIDEALGAIYDGTSTADQDLLAEHIDTVLGAMAASSQLYYNE